MSNASPAILQRATRGTTAEHGDSFRVSVLMLVGVMVAQRVIGVVRNIVFCGLLEDYELGRWSLASNFLGWAAPFVVLGLPGSFGRLSEHYRHRGQLRVFLTRMTIASAVLIMAATSAQLIAPSYLGKLVFNDPNQTSLAMLLALVLAAVIAMNFVTEFLTSVRLNRAVSLMHLVNSFVFTALGTLLIVGSRNHEQALLVAYGCSSLAAAALGCYFVRQVWCDSTPAWIAEPNSNFWKRVMPFAMWIWCGNMLMNFFDLSDQFVLKHFLSLPAETVDAMIGQLYASRIFPMLIVAVSTLVGGSLLPYLIKDWEAGDGRAVSQRMNSVVKLCSFGFTAIAAVTHIASPLLFTWVLRGKYDSGVQLMPMAFVQYTWFGVLTVASKYLIGSDRPRATLWPLLLGLLSSISLIALLMPSFGLLGVVYATMAANGIALVGMLLLSQFYGMKWDRGVWVSSVLPLSLALGGAASLGILIAIVVANSRGEWLANTDEREQLLTDTRRMWAKITRQAE